MKKRAMRGERVSCRERERVRARPGCSLGLLLSGFNLSGVSRSVTVPGVN